MSTDLVLPTGHGPIPAGPWQAAFWFAVPGQVRSKSNYRHKGKSSWEANTSYEDTVFAAMRAAKPAGWPVGDKAVPVRQRPKVVCVLVARALLDTGNLSKSVLDACEGAVFVSDAQVATCTETVHRASQDLGLVAAFAWLPAAASTVQAITAATVLQQEVLKLLDREPAAPR